MENITVPSPVTTFIRYLVALIGAFLVGKGVMTDPIWQTVTELAMAVVPAAYGTIKNWLMKKAQPAS